MWLLFQSASARTVGVVSQLALAYLLEPVQFGVIGLVYTVTGISNTLIGFGVDGVLLQRHRTIRLWTATSFWTGLGLGLTGFLAVACLAPVFAHLYRSPQITELALILASSMPLAALSTVPEVTMRSNLGFRFLAVYSVLDTIGSQSATILLAWNGWGALSFVLPTPVLALVKAVVYWSRAPVRLGARVRLRQVKYLLNNGASVFGTRLITELIAQGDYVVLGFAATHSEVGLYFFAFRLSAQPVWILAGNFTNVLFPVLVRVKADPARQLKGALRAAELLSYVVMPVCFLQAAVAEPALRVFFGERWIGSIHLAQILSLGIPFDAVPWVAGSLLAARRDHRRGLAYALVSLPAFFALVGAGAAIARSTGVATAVAVYYLVFGPVYSLAVFTRHGARAADVASLYVKPPLLAGGAVAVAYAVSFTPWLVAFQLLRLFEMILLGPLLYAALMWRFRPDVLHEVLAKLGVARFPGGAARPLGKPKPED